MNKTIRLTVAASLFCFLFACNTIDIPAPEQELVEDVKPAEPEPKPADPIVLTGKHDEKTNADNRFALNIFRAVAKMSDKPNTFFSPFSLNMALGMLYNGASGDTRAEMAEALGMAGLTETEINEYYQIVSQSLLKADPLTEINIANSIWYSNKFPAPKQSFVDINKNYFDAMVKSLDFSKPDAADIINKWCAEKTKDRIKEIVDSPIPDDVYMYLINALYFKSTWKSEFEKTNTKQDDFTKADNSKIKVNMMEQTASFPYYADNTFQSIEMPYGNEAFSMVIVMGNNHTGIDQLIDNLDDVWRKIVTFMFVRYPFKPPVILKLPRFKVEWEMELNEPVKHIGMQLIFDKDRADLTNIIEKPPLFVSKIKQKTFVEVNEEGTEAAAVTTIETVTAEPMPTPAPIPFFANRPFLYLIKERSSGAILFIGRMDEPEE